MKLRYIFLLFAVAFAILAVYNGNQTTGSQYESSKQIIVLRKIAHELLLSAGDSTSRVLPVKQVKENEYQLLPEKPLAISPDSFVNIVNKTVQAGKLPYTFTANVVRQKDNEIVHGFVASLSKNEGEVSCLGRNLPKDAYYISFIFEPKKSQALFYLLAWGIAAVTLGFVWFRKNRKPVAPEILEEPEPAIEEEAIQEGFIPIGKYFFNHSQQYLELNGERAELTVKENKVLYILSKKINTIIERDTLQKEVWENEGVIVTRSLDMFVSKLRKKLSGDPDIKIVNSHGKGYKLEINS
jgi:DNA-binding winged helix-turn-helix (wHTH) protein